MFVALYVFLAYALVYAPKYVVTVGLIFSKKYDNRHPRDQQAKLEGWSKRAVAAHQNGFESFAGFAASAIMAHIAHVDPFWIHTLCITYLAARALYPIAYIANIHLVRSTIWTFGIVSSLALMFFAFRA